MTACDDNRGCRGLQRSMWCVQDGTLLLSKHAPNVPSMHNPIKQWNIVSLDPDRRQHHVDQSSKVMTITGAEDCKEVCGASDGTLSAFDACPNRPVDKQPHAKRNIVSLDPDRRQNHVEQLSNYAVWRNARIEKTIPKVRLIDNILHHLCFIYFERLRFVQRSRKETSNALCCRHRML